MHDAPPLYPPTFVPPEQPLGLLGFVRRCVENPLATIPRAAYEQPVTRLVLPGGRTVVWLCDPDLIEHLLIAEAQHLRKARLERRVFAPVIGRGVLTAEGPAWRWQRRLLAPLFRHGEILGYVAAMQAAAGATIATWRENAAVAGTARIVRPIEDDMTDATFAVIVRTMLHGGAPADLSTVMRAGRAYLEGTPWAVAYGILGLPEWLPHPASLRLRREARALRRAVGAIIDKRRREGGASVAQGDLLGRLLAARDPETGEPLSDDLLVDNLATLLEAGHETTAKALTWSLYLLARAPHWQDRIRAEVEKATRGGPLSAAHVEQLDVTRRVVKEAMRLYPPAPVMSRTPSIGLPLADLELPAGSEVFIPIYALHRHRMLWHDPDRFDPDRFLPEREAALKRTQYMPFGAGPRICLGASFAMVEASVLLASFVRAAQFGWDGRHLPEPQSRVTLRPKGGMPLDVRLL